MKKILYSFLLLSSATLFAQKNTATKFAVANDIVGTVDMFNNNNNYKGSVQSSKAYKSATELPQNLKKFDYLADNGLVEYKLKSNQAVIDRMPVNELNAQFGLPADTPVLIDGYEFTNTKTLVYGDIINNAQVITSNGKKMVSVTTSRK